MAKDHLQFHGQFGSNGEESSDRSGISGRIVSGWVRGWLDLKQVIALENSHCKDLSSQRIQHQASHELHDESVLGWP